MDPHTLKNKIITGCVGASTAEILTLPVCTIKTVYQSGNKSYLDSVKFIYNIWGIKGFYRASVPAISTQIFASSYKLVLFNILNTNQKSNLYTMMAGIFTSLTCIIFTHPLDYFRVSLQTNRDIFYREMYKGFSANIGKAILGGATFLPLRSIMKREFSNQPSWTVGIMTAAISTVIVHPFEYFKTFMLANDKNTKICFKNPYRGITVNLCRIIPHFVIMTELSDYLMKAL